MIGYSPLNSGLDKAVFLLNEGTGGERKKRHIQFHIHSTRGGQVVGECVSYGTHREEKT